MKRDFAILFIIILIGGFAYAEENNIAVYCKQTLERLPGPSNTEELGRACSDVKQFEGCTSSEGKSIYHLDKVGTIKGGKRILAISLIHGDEFSSGSVTRAWMERLTRIEPRSTWRIIPVVNPDGMKRRTRGNTNGVDLNRNFPTEDWVESALTYWEKQAHKDPRRYPGPGSASEIETQCLLSHIEKFNPDFIVSVHTPLGVLDFDGPKVEFPLFDKLPWKSLGNFPGSLGRYMWIDNGVPVLTIELRGEKPVAGFEMLDRLQDVSGSVAILAPKRIKRTKAENSSSQANIY